MYPLFLAAFLFLSVVPTVAEVVKSVTDCKGFLLQDTPPEIPGILKDGNILNQNRYKPICQTYNNRPRFLTLYDVNNKIPVFSAYKYIGVKDQGRPKGYWKIEPQVCFSYISQICSWLCFTFEHLEIMFYFAIHYHHQHYY